jgi:hypothetical protein
MFEELNLPRADQLDVMNTLLASIASGQEGGISIKSWKDVQRINRMGLAEKIFVEGDRFVAEYDGTPVVWEIAGINHDESTDPVYKNTITLIPVDCLEDRQFSARQAFYNVGAGLAPGTHVFTFATGTSHELQYEFETTQAIPEDGVIVVSSWTGDYEIVRVTTYEADRKTTIESGIDVTKVTGQANTLTPINDHVRCRYGSNNYMESTMKHWLNSDATTWEFVPQMDYDMPPTSAYPTGGFLNRLDPDLVEVLGTVNKQVSKNHHADTDGNGQDTFSDKVFLLSRVEVGLGTEGTYAGEKVYPLFAQATNADRIKLLSGSPRSWWLRSPLTTYSNYVRGVNTSGGLSNGDAYRAYGLVPACVIV